MSTDTRLIATWRTADFELVAFEPTPEEVLQAAPALAGYYNDAHNRAMMANSVAMSASEVVEHFDSLRRAGGRPFLLELGGELLGDADFRHVGVTSAEFAIMIGPRASQGRGIGLRFAMLLHALAFRQLQMERIFVSIIPANVGSQRLFGKLGYVSDGSPQARAFADEESDLTFSVARDAFEAKHGQELCRMEWRIR